MHKKEFLRFISNNCLSAERADFRIVNTEIAATVAIEPVNAGIAKSSIARNTRTIGIISRYAGISIIDRAANKLAPTKPMHPATRAAFKPVYLSQKPTSATPVTKPADSTTLMIIPPFGIVIPPSRVSSRKRRCPLSDAPVPQSKLASRNVDKNTSASACPPMIPIVATMAMLVVVGMAFTSIPGVPL